MNREYQAARFVAQVYSGQMTDQDEQVLRQWLAESAENGAEYRAALETWDQVSVLEGALSSVGRRAKTTPLVLSRSWLKTWWQSWPGLAVAASILLLVAVGLTAWGPSHLWPVSVPAPALASHTTILGQQKVIDLPDGSVISLNTETRVLVDFNAGRRRAILEYGEAYFEVAPDVNRPFVVDTGSRTITVLGTQFGVYKSGFDLSVSVVEGLVAVHRPEDMISPQTPGVELAAENATLAGQGVDQYRLKAGVSARFSGVFGAPSARVRTGPIKGVDKYPYWRTGQLRFDQQPLYLVVKEINRYTTRKVLIEDSGIMDMPVSGVFNIDDIDNALDSFEIALPLRITRYPDRVIIVGSGE